jgi:hypothetical protein
VLSHNIIRNTKDTFDDQVTHHDGEQWRDRIRHCNRYSPAMGVYNSHRQDGDSEDRADNATHNLKMPIKRALGTIDGKMLTLFLRRNTSGSQVY